MAVGDTWFRVVYRHLRHAEGVVTQRQFVAAITEANIALTGAWGRTRWPKPTIWALSNRLIALQLVRTPEMSMWLVINPEIWDALDTIERLGHPVAYKADAEE